MHFSRPSAYRLSWCRPWYLGLVGVFSNGYCSVTVGLNIDEMVTPKPATGASAWPMPFFAGLSDWYPGADAAGAPPRANAASTISMVRSSTSPNRRMPCTPATATTQTSPTGMSTFQPNRMNWSQRKRTSVPRTQTKKNMNSHSLPRNHSTGHQPVLSIPSLIADSGHGARQPPKNRVVATAETLIMLMYSARKNQANFIDEYSVMYPETSSPSASGRSNGIRFVSPTIEMM